MTDIDAFGLDYESPEDQGRDDHEAAMDRIAKRALLVRGAQELIGEEPGDEWDKIAFRVLWHDPCAKTRDVADAVMEAREIRDRAGK